MMRTVLFLMAFSALMLSIAPDASAQENIGVGMVTGVDVATSTLTLETPSGSQRVLVAPTAVIRDDHDRALALRDINPGDAVTYQGDSGPATSVHIARQFWAIPSES
jgi:hypothetical protein